MHTRLPLAFSRALAAALLFILAALATHANDTPNPTQPNLVLIFIDDMGYGDIEPFNPDCLNKTPNLNRMAAEGTKLTSFYAAPVCSASRAQLLTGCYAPRVGVPGVYFPAGPRGLNPDEHTVAETLRDLGYATACVGKWHLGDQPPFFAVNHGFDSYYGIPYSNDMGRETLDGRRVHPVQRDDKVDELIENKAQRNITRDYTEEAIAFIEKSKDKPFFLYLPHTAMHVPLFPHPDFVGTSENGVYGDWVAETDWSVGQILDTLVKHDLDENTLVLFTSDNGPWASKGKTGGISGVLRGSKGGTLEGGVREPTIAWWPGTVPAGASNDAVAGTIDVLPTFAALAGGAPKSDRKIDGKDITDILLGKSTTSPHEAWYYFKGNALAAVRSGPWKFAIRGQSIGMGFREQPDDINSKGRLYHLDDDIGETINVADENPKVVARLQALADEMAIDIKENARPSGHVENPVTLYPTQPRAPRKPKARSKKPFDWTTAKAGASFPPNVAPDLARKPFDLRIQLADADAPGVILAHGGSAIGYSLYTKGPNTTLALRTATSKIHRLRIPAQPDGGDTLRIQLAKDGTLSLTANGKTESTKAALLGKQPQENFCIGHDDANPVDAEAPDLAYRSAIGSIRTASDGPK